MIFGRPALPYPNWSGLTLRKSILIPRGDWLSGQLQLSNNIRKMKTSTMNPESLYFVAVMARENWLAKEVKIIACQSFTKTPTRRIATPWIPSVKWTTTTGTPVTLCHLHRKSCTLRFMYLPEVSIKLHNSFRESWVEAVSGSRTASASAWPDRR